MEIGLWNQDRLDTLTQNNKDDVKIEIKISNYVKIINHLREEYSILGKVVKIHKVYSFVTLKDTNGNRYSDSLRTTNHRYLSP